MITDCHVHVQPYDKFLPASELERMRRSRPDFDLIMQFAQSPACFLKYLDAIGVDRAVLINSVTPLFRGSMPDLNHLAAEYAQPDPRRLLSCATFDPHNTADVDERIAQILRLGLRLIKLHPPHQHYYANDYLNGCRPLEALYRAAEENGIPVMIHTGTSVFPFARNKYGDPIYIDDVAVDFPRLKIIMAHGGRPLWMDTAFFLVRRHPNVYMDVSSIPPRSLLNYFPRLEEVAGKALYGSDWPGPGVPGMQHDLDEFRAVPLSKVAQRKLLADTALEIWPE